MDPRHNSSPSTHHSDHNRLLDEDCKITSQNPADSLGNPRQPLPKPRLRSGYTRLSSISGGRLQQDFASSQQPPKSPPTRDVGREAVIPDISQGLGISGAHLARQNSSSSVRQDARSFDTSYHSMPSSSRLSRDTTRSTDPLNKPMYELLDSMSCSMKAMPTPSMRSARTYAGLYLACVTES